MDESSDPALLQPVGVAHSCERTAPPLTRPALAIVIAVVFLVAAAVPLSGHTFSGGSLMTSTLGLAILVSPLTFARYRKDFRVFATVRGAAMLLSFSAAGTVLSYLVVATNAPLVDATLAAWDRALGFDWLAFSAWLQSRPLLFAGLQFAYYSGVPQLIVVVVVLGMSGQTARLDEFLCLYFLVALLVIAISGPFPAECPWKYYGVNGTFDMAPTSHFEMLREGRMKEIPLGLASQGLVTIPSLHAASAILLVYAMRQTAFLPVFVALNSAMLFSTPIIGGHYLVDVLAGSALSFVVIAMSRGLTRHNGYAGRTVTALGPARPGRQHPATARPCYGQEDRARRVATDQLSLIGLNKCTRMSASRGTFRGGARRRRDAKSACEGQS